MGHMTLGTTPTRGRGWRIETHPPIQIYVILYQLMQEVVKLTGNREYLLPSQDSWRYSWEKELICRLVVIGKIQL